jgi:YVTN family beta-propeller protein
VAVDPAAGTVYVANYDGGTVSVIDEATSAVTATIPVGTGPTGVAVDPAAGTVYVANQGGGAMSVIDAVTRAVTATIPVGSNQFGVTVDPAAGAVYVTNPSNGTVSVIDEATSAVTATVPVGADPFGVAADPSTHTAYVANYANDTVSVITPAAPPAAPSGLAARVAGPVSGPPSGVVLTWTDNATDPAATLERVQRASDPGFTAGVTDFTAGPAATSYTDTAAAEGATYYYRVRAENEASNSAWSNVASILVPRTVPSAPANLTTRAYAQGFISAAIDLTWTENPASAVAGFTIQSATSPAFTTGVTTSTTGPGIRKYTLTGLRRHMRYYIRIESVNGPATSGWTTAAVTTS